MSAPAADLPDAFVRDLVGQVRAGDRYGRLDNLDPDRLLRPYLLTPARPGALGEIPLPCAVDAVAVERIRAYFRAVAAGVERVTDRPTNCALDVDGEGFGRAVVFVGRLVVLCEAVRDVNGFGFRDTAALARHGGALVVAAVRIVTEHPEVASVQP